MRTNALGLRERALQPQSGDRYRIVVFGDSFTFGWGVQAEETWARKLESGLREKGLDVEVINCGKPGTPPQFYAEAAERIVPVLKPDLVLVALFQGDDLASSKPQEDTPHAAGPRAALSWAFPSLTRLAQRWRNPTPGKWVTVEDNRQIDAQRARDFLDEMPVSLRKSFDALEEPIKQAYLEGRLNPFFVRMALYWPDAYTFLLDLEAPETKAHIDCLTAHLQRISRVVLQHEAELLVVSIPHGPYVNLPAYNNVQRFGFAVNPAMLTSEAPDTAFRRACDAAGVPFLAVTAGFREYKMQRGLYFELDGHFTRQGHMLYAQLLLPRLIEHLRVRSHDQKPVAMHHGRFPAHDANCLA